MMLNRGILGRGRGRGSGRECFAPPHPNSMEIRRLRALFGPRVRRGARREKKVGWGAYQVREKQKKREKKQAKWGGVKNFSAQVFHFLILLLLIFCPRVEKKKKRKNRAPSLRERRGKFRGCIYAGEEKTSAPRLRMSSRAALLGRNVLNFADQTGCGALN